MKYALWILLLWPGLPLRAGLEIEGPELAAAGDFVVLQAQPEGLEAAMCRWVVVGLEGNEFSVDSDGRRLCFATRRPGRYYFVLVVVTENPLQINEARHIVTINGSEPSPGPQPPGDVLADWVKSQLKQVPNEAIDARTALAVAFRRVAGVIEQNNLQEAREISLATRGATQAAVPERFADIWKEGFFTPLGKKLSELKLQGTQAHAAAWRSIARGLEEYQP